MKLFMKTFLCGALFINAKILFAKDASVFTTIAFPSEKMSYVAIKKMAKGSEPESSLLEIKTEKMISKKINLPAELEHREIISLIPAKENKLLVLTQYTMERGDNPRLHLFDPSKKTWTSLGEIACVSFAKLKLNGDKLVFSCEESDTKGGTTFVDKEMKISPFATLEIADLTLPVAKLEKGSLKGQFEGLPQEWEKLKLSHEGKEKIFTP